MSSEVSREVGASLLEVRYRLKAFARIWEWIKACKGSSGWTMASYADMVPLGIGLAGACRDTSIRLVSSTRSDSTGEMGEESVELLVMEVILWLTSKSSRDVVSMLRAPATWPNPDALGVGAVGSVSFVSL